MKNWKRCISRPKVKQNFCLPGLPFLFFAFCSEGVRGAVMETAPCNDTTHGSIIIVTIMGLDGITGGNLACLEPHDSFISSEVFGSASTRGANGVNYQLITQTEAISFFLSDWGGGEGYVRERIKVRWIFQYRSCGPFFSPFFSLIFQITTEADV